MLTDLSAPLVHAELADLVGVTRQAISAGIAEGRIPAGATLGETLRLYVGRLREQAAGRLGSEVGGLDLAQERAALAREMRLGHEIKNSVARGTYVIMGDSDISTRLGAGVGRDAEDSS